MRDQHLGNAVRHIQRVVQFGRVHAGNAEREARADLFQRIDRKPGSGSFHHAPSSLVSALAGMPLCAANNEHV